ncbi:MAG: hypothetical protein AAGI03_13545 [Pseudomonadota bacterium]
MGGYGSGRPRTNSYVEDAIALDLGKLIRDQLLRPGCWRGSLVWRNTETQEETASISYTAHMGAQTGTGLMELAYSCTGSAGEQTPIRENVTLEGLRQPFGGRIWHFRCPQSDRRCRKLFLPPGAMRFAARQVYGLTYRSQAEAPHDRALSQAFKIRQQLKSEDGIGDFIVRPLGMHRKTFQRELDRLARYEAVCEARTVYFLERLRSLSKSQPSD